MSLTVPNTDVYEGFGARDNAVSYKALFQYATTDPCLRTAITGETEYMGGDIPEEDASFWLRPTLSAVARRQGQVSPKKDCSGLSVL